MKFLIVLLFVASCASNEKPAAEPVTGAPAVSSDTKSPSPYTVKPCYCMKIFKPVCGADGQNYGNSCEAECKGNKTWKDGSCPK